MEQFGSQTEGFGALLSRSLGRDAKRRIPLRARYGAMRLCALLVCCIWLAPAQEPEAQPKPPLTSGQPSATTPGPAGTGRTLLTLSAPEDCEVVIDGYRTVQLRSGKLTQIPIAPGPHLITATAAGARTLHRSFTVLDGSPNTLVVEFPTSGGAADRTPPANDVAATGPGMNGTDGLPYVWLPAGAFQMGCVPQDRECDIDEKRHSARIETGFYIGKTEVTVAAFARFRPPGAMPDPPHFDIGWQMKDNPIVKVSWDEAESYCEWAGGRLPTEVEMEYAARGGSTDEIYPWGNDIAGQTVNYRGGKWPGRTMPVGTGPPNAWGLYGMAGNAAEWVGDWYSQLYYEIAPEKSSPRTHRRNGPRGARRRLHR